MQFRLLSLSMFAGALLIGCAHQPETSSPDLGGLAGLLAFQRTLPGLDGPELAKLRNQLTSQSTTPEAQMRLALLHAQTKGGDVARAQTLLDSLLKSNSSEARSLQPMARLLAEQLAERQRLESQLERQGVLLKESQRKVQELQEKIDRLAEIERSLPSTNRAGARP